MNEEEDGVHTPQQLQRVDNPFGNDSKAVTARPTAMIEIERERAITEVQAAITVAKRFPRDQRHAMDAIINECAIPELAAIATYDYVRGGEEISGPTIRLAEVVARSWGNMEFGVRELSRHEGVDGHAGYSDCQAYAWDLQTMVRDTRTFQVKHWRDTKNGGYALKDERDIYEIVANIGARRKRACIESVIPRHVFQSALKQCALTNSSKVEITPETIKTMLETFAAFGVTQEMIEKRIQRRLQEILPQQALKMKRIYNSLSQEMSRVEDWFEVPAGGVAQPAETTKSGRKAPKKKAASDQSGSAGNELPAGEGSSNATSSNTPPAQQQSQRDPDPQQDAAAPINASQLATIMKELEASALGTKDLCKALGLQKIDDIRVGMLPAVTRWILNPT